MTEFRPSSTVAPSETGDTYPATVTGPLALSDDVTAASYVLFRGMDENGKRSSSASYFDPIPATLIELQLLVEPQVSGANLRIQGSNSAGTVSLFDLDPLWGVGTASPTPGVGSLTWVTTGPIAISPGFLSAGDFHVRLVNRTPTTGQTSDIYVYEMKLLAENHATHAPPLRQFPRNDGLAGSARRLWPAPRSRQHSSRRAGGYL